MKKKTKNQSISFSTINHVNVKWHLPFIDEITESETEGIEDDIESFLKSGYSSGQLIIVRNDREISGWWEVIDWKSIALDLYNHVGSEANAIRVKSRFDLNWN